MNVIHIRQNTNVFDYLIQSVWKHSSKVKTILMREGNDEIVVKVGETMDGEKFMFQDDLDFTYGIREL